MLIQSSVLKTILKRLSPAKSELVILARGGLVASDSDITISVAHEAFDFATPISVNARKFSSVVNRMSGSVDLTLSANVLTLRSAKAKVDMETAVVKRRTFVQPETLQTIPLAPMKDVLKYASMAADTNKAAFMGGVVQFETTVKGFEDERITGFESMGTDGKRCAYTEVDVEGLTDKFKYMIPLPAVAAIQTLDGETVQVGEADSFYFLKSSHATIWANKLNKPTPNYKSFLPHEFKFTAAVDAAEMKRVLYTVEPMVQDVELRAVYVHFLDGRLNIRTVGQGGTAEDELEYVSDPLADVTEFKIKIDHRYLNDYFSLVSGDVVFNANAPDKPIILESGNRNLMIAPVGGGSK